MTASSTMFDGCVRAARWTRPIVSTRSKLVHQQHWRRCSSMNSLPPNWRVIFLYTPAAVGTSAARKHASEGKRRRKCETSTLAKA
mmetsp:Transcript_117247/g.318298  ORF Transcript_117247/g.318298 Transcript_117247/m.318298 type:complete len:85 (+) Transcript_117247:135-389(+)